MSQSAAKTVSPLSVLFDVALIAWSSYRLWQGAAGIWRVLYVAVIAMCGFSLLSKLLLRGVGTDGSGQSTAEGIRELQKNLYSGAHEYRPADDSELRGLDGSFYDRATAALEQLGFRRVGQIVDATAERTTPWARAVLRCFLDRDGTTMGAVYDVRFRSWYRGLQLIRFLPKDLRTIDLETELSDWRFVATSNATDAAMASEFPGVHRRFFSKDVPIPELLEHHRRHVHECLNLGGGSPAHPLVLRTYEDYRAAQDRLQILKSAHRSSSAYDPAEEMSRITGRPLNADEQRVADRVREMREAERREG